ncbi:hypothetical protein ACH5RR_034988 [Cinchona calisaya]|uniref:Uncharacterized protein n=1 Tax=Cinchona calisaya TaxID=153742 RepID=A0ABD2YFJ1_9GENT
MIYGKETILYHEIKSALKSKEQIDKDIIEKIGENQAEGLVARGRSEKRDFDSSKSKFRSKSRHKNMVYNCYRKKHIKFECFKLKNKDKHTEKSNQKTLILPRLALQLMKVMGIFFFVTDDRTRSKNE